MVFRDFLGSSVVKTSLSNAGIWGSIPGQRAKNPTSLMASKSKHRKKKTRNNIVTNSIKDFKMVHILIYTFGLPWCLNNKESTCHPGDTGLIPGLGRHHKPQGPEPQLVSSRAQEPQLLSP